MNIGFNARFLSISEPGGAAATSFELLEHLVEIDTENKYFIFTTGIARDVSPLRRKNTEIIECSRPFENRVGTVLWDQVTLPRLVRRYDVELLHNPMTSAPVLFDIPNMVVTIHGLAYRHSDGYNKIFTLWYDWLVRRVAERTDTVITVSDYQRQDLIAELDLPPGKVRRIYNGVDPHFLDFEPDEDHEPPRDLPNRYILFVGSLNPVKNIAGLIRAFSELKERTSVPHKLVIVGPEKAIFEEVDVPPSADIVRLGFVARENLPEVYANAEVLVQPSFYESFGLPPLEAMACGTPVIAADAAALPEVVDGAAALVDPHDTTELATTIHAVLTDESLREQLIERGYRRAETFNWRDCAHETLDVYEDLME